MVANNFIGIFERKRIIVVFLILAYAIHIKYGYGQQSLKNYVIHPDGLSLYSDMSVISNVIQNIPYSDSVELIPDNHLSSYDRIIIDSIPSRWVRAKYRGMEGYLPASFLFSYPAPSLNTKDLSSYMKTIANLAMPEANYFYRNMYEDDYSLKKLIFANGMEAHYYEAYETISFTYFLPNVSIEQGYALVRLLEEFWMLNENVQYFPVGDGIHIADNETNSYEIWTKVENDNGYISSLEISINTGGFFDYSFYYQYGVLVIVFSNYI